MINLFYLNDRHTTAIDMGRESLPPQKVLGAKNLF
jgi:hypothetical protein